MWDFDWNLLKVCEFPEVWCLQVSPENIRTAISTSTPRKMIKARMSQRKNLCKLMIFLVTFVFSNRFWNSSYQFLIKSIIKLLLHTLSTSCLVSSSVEESVLLGYTLKLQKSTLQRPVIILDIWAPVYLAGKNELLSI